MLCIRKRNSLNGESDFFPIWSIVQYAKLYFWKKFADVFICKCLWTLIETCWIRHESPSQNQNTCKSINMFHLVEKEHIYNLFHCLYLRTITSYPLLASVVTVYKTPRCVAFSDVVNNSTSKRNHI